MKLAMGTYDSTVLLILLVMAAGIIFINGMTTDVSLGDESHHYHLTENIYRAGKRVAFDPLYESGNPPGFFYNDPPLWHLSVATLWKIWGGPSQAIAQLFHLLFFGLLVWMTHLLAKETMGEKERWFPALIIATVPMVVSFSTLLYMDVPVTALSAWSYYSVLKRRYVQGGMASSLAFFTKLNAAFFLPGFLFLIVWKERKSVWGILKNLTLFIIPVLLIHVPDRYWRQENIASQVSHVNLQVVVSRVTGGGKGGILGAIMGAGTVREYFNSYLTNPVDVGKYFGIALVLLVVFYFIYFRRRNKQGLQFWIPVISYLVVFLFFFGIRADIRYLLPILPFLIVAVAPVCHWLGRKWRVAVLGLCLLQFASTTYYVHQMRQISPAVKEGYEYVKKNLPENALILYPEENLLLYGQRRMVWSMIRSLRLGQSGIYTILWTPRRRELDELLRVNGVDYVLIKKSRIFDQQNEHHAGGYPRSFVENLEELSQRDRWMKAFENSELTLWKAI
jgi:hypothetical protein